MNYKKRNITVKDTDRRELVQETDGFLDDETRNERKEKTDGK